MHQRALERERLLKEENQQLQAQNRYLKQQLYGKKSETTKGSDHSPSSAEPTAKDAPGDPPRLRGQQRGRPGPKRRDYSHLPGEEEILDLTDEDKKCPCCGLPFEPFPGTED